MQLLLLIKKKKKRKKEKKKLEDKLIREISKGEESFPVGSY